METNFLINPQVCQPLISQRSGKATTDSMQDGYISTYEELRAIWPDLPEKVTDSLGLGFVVKAAPGGGLKVRLILDCSRPSEGSVNSNIKDYSTTLPTVFGNITALSDPKTQNFLIGPLNARRRELSNGVRKYTIGSREGTQAFLVP